MRLIALASSTLACIGFLVSTASVGNADSLNRCHEVAKQCREEGSDGCQQQVDACMSENACEEVYLSCLELMEADETLTEAACEKKKAQCRRRFGQ